MKKILSILLSAIIALSVCVTAFAAADEGHDPLSCESDPVIIVRGMDFMNVLLNPGEEDERLVNELSFKQIAPWAGKILLKLAQGDKDAAIETLIDASYDIFKYNSMDETGHPVYNTGMTTYPQSVDNYDVFYNEYKYEFGSAHTFIENLPKGHTYMVTYDWRLDPLEVADTVNEAVETALRETGHSRVKIVCSSMGGIMTVAYLTKYGYDKVERCLFMSSTFCGAQIASDLLTGRIEITPDALYNLVSSYVSDNFILSGLVSALYKAGLFGAVTRITDYIIDNYKDEVYERVLTPIFGCTPTIWGLIQDGDFDEAVDFMFGSDTEKYAAIIEKASALREMMNNRDELLDEMMSNGVKVAVVSNYGLPMMPIYSGAVLTGDRILEAPMTSGYATIAPYGKTLGDDYVAKDESLVSPDNIVDLSTALLPEYTYMVKYAPHVASSYGTDYGAFLLYLVTADDLRAGANEKYPQFMISDEKNETLAPLVK